MTDVTNTQIDQDNDFLSEINTLKQRPPFASLQPYLIKSIQAFSRSKAPAKKAIPIPTLGPSLLQHLLNKRIIQFGKHADLPISFVSEAAMNMSAEQSVEETNANSPYYETFIAQTKSIPTRCNWHDFYNGLIWLQFPKSKVLFNLTHQQEIEQYGRRFRSPIRDKLTHFDECGLLLVTDQDDLQDEIKKHDWQRVFVERKEQWQINIKPVIFGHALWEMLMQPFIGLTAKVTIIQDASLLAAMQEYPFVPTSVSSAIDSRLHAHISKNRLLEQRKPWLPFPLLGIPGWSHVPQTAAFYANEAYFMPKPQKN